MTRLKSRIVDLIEALGRIRDNKTQSCSCSEMAD
jgi:hypothetical protein